MTLKASWRVETAILRRCRREYDAVHVVSTWLCACRGCLGTEGDQGANAARDSPGSLSTDALGLAVTHNMSSEVSSLREADRANAAKIARLESQALQLDAVSTKLKELQKKYFKLAAEHQRVKEDLEVETVACKSATESCRKKEKECAELRESVEKVEEGKRRAIADAIASAEQLRALTNKLRIAGATGGAAGAAAAPPARGGGPAAGRGGGSTSHWGR